MTPSYVAKIAAEFNLDPKQFAAAIAKIQAEQPAVAWIRRHKNDLPSDRNLCIDQFREDADRWQGQFKDGYAWLDPLFTFPPKRNS